jgi:hypothetical protein
MLRAPMSRMDILTSEEMALLSRSSSLVPKYSQDIDRESAYEILSKKIESIEKTEADEAVRKEWEKENERERSRPENRRPSYTGRPASRRTAAHPVVKVLTSATFIRGMLGILKKVM